MLERGTFAFPISAAIVAISVSFAGRSDLQILNSQLVI